MEVTRQEQRSYVKIAVLRGRNAKECHSELTEALGNRALPTEQSLDGQLHSSVGELLESRRCKKAGPHYLTMDAQ